ncbi:MAG: NAD-dependent protein deacetylase [Polyangiaceae bacterium]
MSTDLDVLLGLAARGRMAVLTGAGVSTESGIPDYRGEGTRQRAKNPIDWKTFSASHAARSRYWARSLAGWARFSGARPNRGHIAIAEMERAGRLTGLVTQNVDRLHHEAGSERVVELHGALAETRCVRCGERFPRAAVQARMIADNPAFAEVDPSQILPDGDSTLPDELVERFVPPTCTSCGDYLRPDVVFFGESVPRPKVDEAMAMVDAADALLIVGTSLAVFSGYRFLRRAVERKKPIAIVNVGPVRGEEDATIKIEAGAGGVLAELVERSRPAWSADVAARMG